MRPLQLIFSMLQCLVAPFINSANQAPGVQTGHTKGINSVSQDPCEML